MSPRWGDLEPSDPTIEIKRGYWHFALLKMELAVTLSTVPAALRGVLQCLGIIVLTTYYLVLENIQVCMTHVCGRRCVE